MKRFIIAQSDKEFYTSHSGLALSGKFATNALILTLGGLAYNSLRAIGQLGLVDGHTPVRHPAQRRRINTVIQELMYLAARQVKTGRHLKLIFSRHCAASGALLSRLFI